MIAQSVNQLMTEVFVEQPGYTGSVKYRNVPYQYKESTESSLEDYH